jgi:transposase-like protein
MYPPKVVKVKDCLKSEDACVNLLLHKRWPNGIVCPFDKCNSKHVYVTNRGFKCAKCRNKFTIKSKTIFEGSRLPLKQWFSALKFISEKKVAITSICLSKHLKISQRSAWAMIQKLMPEIHDHVFGKQQYSIQRGLTHLPSIIDEALISNNSIYQPKLCVNENFDTLIDLLVYRKKRKKIIAKINPNNDFIKSTEFTLNRVKGKQHIAVSLPKHLILKGFQFNKHPIDLSLHQWGDYICNCNLGSMDYFEGKKTAVHEIKFYKPKHIQRIGFFVIPNEYYDINELEFYAY